MTTKDMKKILYDDALVANTEPDIEWVSDRDLISILFELNNSVNSLAKRVSIMENRNARR